MANKMQRYLWTQPEVFASILDGENPSSRQFAEWCNRGRRLIIIGSGSSCYAAQMARPTMERLLRMEVCPMEPTALSDTALPHMDGCIYLVVSQEGKSINAHSALQKLKQRGLSVAALTSNPDSPIAQGCDLHIYMACGEEASGPKTVGVSSTWLCLCRLALEIAAMRGAVQSEELVRTSAELTRASELLKRNLLSCVRWYESKKPVLMKAPSLGIIASGASVATATEGALKLIETIYIPCMAFNYQEFIHGPHCLLKTDMQLIFLLEPGDDSARMADLASFAKGLDMQVHLISANLPGDAASDLRLECSGCDAPLQLLLPFQVISAYLAEEMGHDLDRPKFEGFAARFGSKMQV